MSLRNPYDHASEGFVIGTGGGPQSPYRVQPPLDITTQAVDVAREVLARGHIAHVLVHPGGALVQAHSNRDGRTVLGAVSLPEMGPPAPGFDAPAGCNVAVFLAELDATEASR